MVVYNQINLPLERKKILKKTVVMLLSLKGVTSILFYTVMIYFLAFMTGSFWFSYFEKSGQSSSSIWEHLSIYIIVIGLVTVTLIRGIIAYIYQSYYYKSYKYEFRDDGASITKGVVSRSTGNVRYEKLQNVYVDQDILDRVFGLYDVHYETAGEISEPYYHVDGLNQENAGKLIAFLNAESKGHSNITAPAAVEIQQSAFVPEDRTALLSSENIKPTNPILARALILTMVMMIIMPVVFFILSIPLSKVLVQIMSLKQFLVLSEVAAIAFSIYAIIYSYFYYKNYYFDFGPEKGEIITRVIGTRTTYIYYDRIQDINIIQSAVDRLLGLYNIYISTASGETIRMLSFHKDEAGKIRDFLLKKAKTYRGGGL